MLITTSWMRSNYNKYNAEYFNGILPEISFEVSRSKNRWGYAEYRFNRSTDVVTPTRIVMSNYYDSPEKVKLTTLLHEMIHIYDYTINPHHFVRFGKKVRKYDSHGSWFKSECARLAKYGWDIEKYVTAEERACSTLSGRSKVLEQNKIDQALLCVIVGSNGYNWVVKTNDSHVKTVLNTITNCRWNLTLGTVKDINFYRFNNPKLATMRSAGTKLRGWKYNRINLLRKLEEYKATEIHIKNVSYYIDKVAA